MSAIAAVSRASSATDGGAFARALRDPKVLGVARAMNVDLSDPGTLQSLLARTRRAFESAAQVTLGAAPAMPARASRTDPAAIRDRYVRDAIRLYQEIADLA